MYVMPENDGNWKSEAYITLRSLFNRAKCVTVSPRKKIEDGYAGCICSDNIDVSRQLKIAGVVKDYQTKYVILSAQKDFTFKISSGYSLARERGRGEGGRERESGACVYVRVCVDSVSCLIDSLKNFLN